MRYLIACGCIAAFAIYTEKRIINPITILSLLWGIIVFFSKTALYGLYSTQSEQPYIFIMVGLVSFAVGYYIMKLLRKDRPTYFVFFKTHNKNNLALDYKVCYICLVVTILVSILKLKDMGLNIFQIGFDFASIGNVITQADAEGHSQIINLLYFFTASPLYLAITVVFSFECLKKNKDKIVIILSIVTIILRLFVTGGRIALIQLFLSFVVAYLFPISSTTDSVIHIGKSLRKRWKRLAIISIMFLIAFYFATLSRGMDIAKNLYCSFGIQPYLLEYWCKEIGDNRAFGLCSLNGFFYPVVYIIKNLFRLNELPGIFADIYINVQNTFNHWVPCGQYSLCNAYSSAFWYLYYDGGIIGIIVGMAIWGMVSFNSFVKAKKVRSYSSVANFAIILIGLFYTFTDMEFNKPSYVLAIIYMNYLLIRKKEERDTQRYE